jgi:hypothetical protein
MDGPCAILIPFVVAGGCLTFPLRVLILIPSSPLFPSLLPVSLHALILILILRTSRMGFFVYYELNTSKLVSNAETWASSVLLNSSTGQARKAVI